MPRLSARTLGSGGSHQEFPRIRDEVLQNGRLFFRWSQTGVRYGDVRSREAGGGPPSGSMRRLRPMSSPGSRPR